MMMDKMEAVIELIEILVRDEAIVPDTAQDLMILRASLERRPELFRNSEHHDHKEGEGVKWEPGVDFPPVGATCLWDRDGYQCPLYIFSHHDGWAHGWNREIQCGFSSNNPADFQSLAQSHRDKVIEAAHDFFMDKGSIPHRKTLGKAYDAGFLKLPEDS